MWYVVSMDDIIAEAPTYREARQACLSSCLDGRKYPNMRQDRHVCHLVWMDGNTPISGVLCQDFTLTSSHLVLLPITGSPIS
jgi:hypothetical protein